MQEKEKVAARTECARLVLLLDNVVGAMVEATERLLQEDEEAGHNHQEAVDGSGDDGRHKLRMGHSQGRQQRREAGKGTGPMMA